MHRGPGNLQMLHHHPFESYGPVMDNVSGYGMLPPGQQPPTSSSLPNYPAPPHPYNQPPPPQQHLIPAHGARERDRDRDRERDRERERERERDRHFAVDPALPHPPHQNNFASPRSISPVHVNSNGVLKATNGWMSGPGVIPADERVPTAKESRREREREEARANRQEREREREHEREHREREGVDRERNHQLLLMQQQQQQQRHQPPQPPGGPMPPQHHQHHHHHHVVHHHHPMPPPPSYNHNQPGYLSPRRVSRDLDYNRPRSNPSLPTEVIDLNPSGPSKRSMVNVSPVLSSGREQREREREREREQREREREREIHEQNSRMPPLNHTRPSSRNAPNIGPGPTEHPRLPLPPFPSSNVDRDRERERDRDRDRDRERERERERMMTPFVIPPSQATQAHFSTTPDAVPKVVREVRDVRERREPGPGLPGPEELMMSIG